MMYVAGLQGVALPQMVSMYVGAALSPLYSWLLVFKLGLGLRGAALGIAAVQGTALTVMLLYLFYREAHLRGTPKQTWHGW